jgi:glycosyltransferase involved in cell wall biosynthesis
VKLVLTYPRTIRSLQRNEVSTTTPFSLSAQHGVDYVRILQATETHGPGGAEQVIISLCTTLRAAGHQVEVVMLKPGWLADRLAAEGIPVHRLHLARPLDPRFLWRLVSFLREHRPDLLHTHEFTFAFYGRLAARITRTPIVATAHGANFADGAKRRILGTALLRPGRRFRLAAVSEALAHRLARAFLLPVGRLDVVRNGIAIPAPPNGARDAAGAAFRLVAVGNLYPVKNHAALIRVVATLRTRGVPAELDILGRGGEEEPLRQEIARHSLDGIVRLQGFRPDVDHFLETSDVFVSASLSEQMPLSFLEAMARGLPVVASSVGGVPEIVEDGQDGLLFASGDEAAAAAHLEHLWRDPGNREALGRRARAKVETRYGARTMAEAHLTLYAKTTGGRGGKASL